MLLTGYFKWGYFINLGVSLDAVQTCFCYRSRTPTLHCHTGRARASPESLGAVSSRVCAGAESLYHCILLWGYRIPAYPPACLSGMTAIFYVLLRRPPSTTHCHTGREPVSPKQRCVGAELLLPLYFGLGGYRIAPLALTHTCPV
jgi:hypothetical protein